MKPVIGVMPLVDEERESLWMLPGYFEGIADAGGIPVMLPLTYDEDVLRQLVGMCDGLLFTGGHDVSPQLYGERPISASVIFSNERDAMESIALREGMKGEKAILGICRGIQFINAALGGSLYQDLPTQHPSGIEHHQKPPYDIPVHEVEIAADTPLHTLLGVDRLAVNSYHHQAVKTIAPGLKAMATAEDGLTEAVYKPDYPFLWAVQWHPEFSFKRDPAARAIFHSFTRAAMCTV